MASVSEIIGMTVKVVIEISWISRCPAVKLAVSRTPRAIGRMKRLIVSIITSMGMSAIGVPSGNKWARASVGFFCSPIRTVANHIGTANPIFIDSWVVGV